MAATLAIAVCFRCWNPQPVVALAERLLPLLRHQLAEAAARDEGSRTMFEALDMLESFTARRGNSGWFAWAGECKNAEVDEFLEALRPFWEELLDARFPFGGENWSPANVLVLYEREGWKGAGVVELCADDWRKGRMTVVMRTHENLPFSLEQPWLLNSGAPDSPPARTRRP